MLQLTDFVQFLDRCFAVAQYGDDQGGIYHASDRPIHRLGLALEPWPGLPQWVAQERLNALFLHRPWRLDRSSIAPDVGVIAYHLAFDEHLTLGYNTRLAAALGMINSEVLGTKEDRPLGMIGDVPAESFNDWAHTLHEIFSGTESVQPGAHATIERVAVVGAMTDALVRDAAERGAHLYITGQSRQPARNAVTETGINVVEVGHRRSEEWGLRALAGVLRERWAQLEVVLHEHR